MKLDIEAIARRAGAGRWINDRLHDKGEMLTFARLVLEEAAKVCDTTPPYPFRASIEAAHAIRALLPVEGE